MEQLVVRSIVEDSMLYKGMDKKELDNIIKTKLIRSLSEQLIDKNIDTITVKRPFYYGDPLINSGGTEFEMRVFILTKEEHEEYNSLKQAKKQIRSLLL